MNHPTEKGPEELVERARRGEVAAAARLISWLESGRETRRIAAALGGCPLPDQVIGVTGAPGVGKSTLIAALLGLLRAETELVGVIAVDPSSAVSGGALLADRLRMGEHGTDPGIFIRSLAGRGMGRALAAAVGDVLRVMTVAGFRRVLLETVGAGQDEHAVTDVADTVVLVTMPASGDLAQALKMGITEAADVIVVNKADRDPAGAQAAAGHLELALDAAACTCRLARQFGVDVADPWRPPVLEVSATERQGLEALTTALAEHQGYLRRSGLGERAQERRLSQEIVQRATALFEGRLREQTDQVDRLAAACRDGRLDVLSAARQLADGV